MVLIIWGGSRKNKSDFLLKKVALGISYDKICGQWSNLSPRRGCEHRDEPLHEVTRPRAIVHRVVNTDGATV